MGVSQRPPIWPSPQSARLSTVRPASATTSAPSVRKACTCIRAVAIRPVPRAQRPPTAPWSAAVLVSLWGCYGPRGLGPREGAGRACLSPTCSPSPDSPVGFVPRFFWPLDQRCLQPQAQAESSGRAPLGHSGVPRGDLHFPFFLSLFPPFLPAQCEMSEWSPWGPCSKKKRLCGFRRGSEERTRRVLHAPGGDHTICSDTKETRRCTVRRTPCPEGELRAACASPGLGGGDGHGGLITSASCLSPRKGPQAGARWEPPVQDAMLGEPVPGSGREQSPELHVVGAGSFSVCVFQFPHFL